MAKIDPKILFGARIRFLRKQADWSQEQLAFKCGLDRTYVGGVERGERNISLLNIFKLAVAFGIDPKELLDFRKIDRQ